ncbi:MAG: LemA family protein [Elusimicrobiota bacterium]
MVSFIVIGAVIFAVIGSVGYLVTLYNGMVIVKNNVGKSWANIDVLLKQRHDEIPKLIKTCEGYMKHERETLSRVIALRNSAQSVQGVADKASAEGALSAGLRQLFALAENYPDLKAQSSFQQLQSRISELENQIADRREFYNESVNNFNIRIQSLPDLFVAGFMGLQAAQMYKVNEADKADVDVTFNMS